MTDLLTEVNSKSNTLDLSTQTIQRDVATLAEQFQTLGVEDPLVIVVGRKTAAAFAKHERYLADALGLSKVRWVTIPHYSAANSRVHGNSPEKYRRLVMEALNSI
jgi:malonyl CoA-acyl carrier protein transacylase